MCRSSSEIYDWRVVAGRLFEIPNVDVIVNQKLASISSWAIGGSARILVRPSHARAIPTIINRLNEVSVPRIVIGETSNLLFDSGNLDVAIVQIGSWLSRLVVKECTVEVEAGYLVSELVRDLAVQGIGGFVHAAGIPGTIGGLVVMNGGTQRRGIGENVLSVTVVDQKGRVRRLRRDQLDFAYRHSALQSSGDVVLSVELATEQVDADKTMARIHDQEERRSRKYPLTEPNCGSVFVSDPAMYSTVGPPGHIIEQLGLKGKRIGGAAVSNVHANFIVNIDDATHRDVLGLISLIRGKVLEHTGFSMQCEVRYVSPRGTITAAHEAADEMTLTSSREVVE